MIVADSAHADCIALRYLEEQRFDRPQAILEAIHLHTDVLAINAREAFEMPEESHLLVADIDDTLAWLREFLPADLFETH